MAAEIMQKYQTHRCEGATNDIASTFVLGIHLLL